jgi:hypothetical protein
MSINPRTAKASVKVSSSDSSAIEARVNALDQCFSSVFLKHHFKDFEESFLWQTSNACWDEYAACRLSGPRPIHKGNRRGASSS